MINTQNRNKTLITIIGILLLANILLAYFLLMKRDGAGRDKRADRKAMIGNFLKKEIGFDTAQLSRYDILSNSHTGNMKQLMDSLRGSKEKQFKELAAASFSDSAMNLVAEKSAATQKNMELRMFNHLKTIRQLCRPDQLPKFDSLFGKMLNRKNGGGQQKSK